jgi:hypothetical protein
MSKLNSVASNFLEHLTSGLSLFMHRSYAACESRLIWKFEVDLLAQTPLPAEFLGDADLGKSVLLLRDKFESILTHSTSLTVADIQAVIVFLDFMPNNGKVDERRAWAAKIPIWYGYNPVYACELRVTTHRGDLLICRKDDLEGR